MLGELTNSQALHVLNNQVTGRIGCYANNRIYIVPITYAFDNMNIYGHSKEGMKINMMRSNPDVCFQVDIIENMANWRSVIAWGKYKELTDEVERIEALTIITSKVMPLTTSETVRGHDHSHEPQVVVKEKRAIIFRIHVEEITGRFEKR